MKNKTLARTIAYVVESVHCRFVTVIVVQQFQLTGRARSPARDERRERADY